MAQPPVDLELRDVTVRYGHVLAVDAVCLAVERGAIVAVLGANGAGKTSLLTALAGICPGETSGSVALFGRDRGFRPAHQVVHDGMVLVPEGRRVFAPLTVEENLLVGGYTQRKRAAAQKGLAEVYELFPMLQKRRSVPAGLLSGGEQEMLAFGRAMMSQPRLILMDEPSMGLAPIMVDRVMDALRSINDQGTSILVVEQNAAAVLRVASYAYVFANGRVVHGGSAEEVRSDPAVASAFLGLGEEADVV
ncbi:MAG: ABC transporter ATP-binding protein [Actinomycetota bacterium]|jgi:branched-chain amino acid transport system ATP-binding protein|nr:ABC transporter ATP-binding protein [Actinomycetota bacterium]